MPTENKKIIGVLPVGGNAVRLGLPSGLSKSMLPQAGKDTYIPVICHTIQKMQEAGATEIYFIHAKNDYKKDIVEWFNEDGYWHIQQRKDNFANTLLSSIHHYLDKNQDYRILYGLPDTIFEDNPYISLAGEKGLAVALFEAEDTLKVDRLIADDTRRIFEIKSVKTNSNEKWFWGCFALDSADLTIMIKDNAVINDSEIGLILNGYQKHTYYFGQYLDLGIWSNMNKYWSKGI